MPPFETRLIPIGQSRYDTFIEQTVTRIDTAEKIAATVTAAHEEVAKRGGHVVVQHAVECLTGESKKPEPHILIVAEYPETPIPEPGI